MCKRKVVCLAFVCTFALASVASAELVAWWTLDEDGGAVAADSSGKENHGTLEDGPTVVEGVSGNALAFDNSRVTIPASDSLTAELFQGSFTLAGWINPSRSGNTWQQIFRAWRTGDASNDTLFVNNDGRLSWRGRVGGAWAGGMCETAPAVVAADEWAHFAVVGDETNFRVYVGGILSQESAFQTTDGENVSYYIGGDPPTAGESYAGMVDELRVYNHALTEAEIKELAARPKAYGPTPANNALAVVTPLLQWKAGTSAMFHDVYFGTTAELTEAALVSARQPFAMYYHVAGFEPGATYYWRIDEIEPDMTTIHTGDVWTFLAQATTAYYPNPADGAVDATTAPTLTWLPGLATVKHHVYFSDDLDAVTQGAADADKGEVEEATFAPGDLEAVATYYWRVDEAAVGGEVVAGPVWSFTTSLPVDDFESYTDDEGSRIYETWIDGWTNGTGSTVGNIQAPFAEQTIIRSPIQSMPIDYNNVNSPFYSEAEREFAPAEDWTFGGVENLVLHVRGSATNAAAVLYIVLEDSAGAKATVSYADDTAAKASKWIEWKIALSDFAGVNPARIKKVTIGVGDSANPTPGGAGRIYVDDIYVTK